MGYDYGPIKSKLNFEFSPNVYGILEKINCLFTILRIFTITVAYLRFSHFFQNVQLILTRTNNY